MNFSNALTCILLYHTSKITLKEHDWKKAKEIQNEKSTRLALNKY